MMKKRLTLVTFGAVLLGGIGLISWLFFSSVVDGQSQDVFSLRVEKGMSFHAVTTLLQKQKIIDSALKLKLTARILNLHNQLKAGKYSIRGGLSSYGLLQKLTDGRVVVERVTIPEGLQARQIAALLSRRVEIDSTEFMSRVNDSSYARRLGFETETLEGFLFPNTYNLHWGTKAQDIIARMVQEFKKNFDEQLRARTKEIGFTVRDIIALASIVEGEAMVDSERAAIAAVYHNRLKRGVLLQADPTIQYIIADGPRRLLKRDLQIDSPYNTYKYRGLPPGPIGNPGLASIKASLYPAEVDYLYFVANGDGTHTFSRTFREHLRAKAEFDRYRREIKRKSEQNRAKE